MSTLFCENCVALIQNVCIFKMMYYLHCVSLIDIGWTLSVLLTKTLDDIET